MQPTLLSRSRSRVIVPAAAQGQSLVEFALVLPLLLMVAFSVFEFGFMINDQIALANAVRDGARTGSLSSANQSAAVSEVQSDLSGALISCSAGTPAATYAGSNPQTVTVSASCSYAPITPLGSLVALLGKTLSTSATLTSSTAMRVEQ